MRIPFVYTSHPEGSALPRWHLDALEHEVPDISSTETRPFDVRMPSERGSGGTVAPHLLHDDRIWTRLDVDTTRPDGWLTDRLSARGVGMDLPLPPVAGAWTLPYAPGGAARPPSAAAPPPGVPTTRERFAREAAAHARELVLVDGVLHSSAFEPCAAAAISGAQKERPRTNARIVYRSVLDDWRVSIPMEFRSFGSAPPVIPLAVLEANELPMLHELEFLSGSDRVPAAGAWTPRMREADINCHETLRFVEDRFLGARRAIDPDPALLRLRARTSVLLSGYEDPDGTPPWAADAAELVRDWQDAVVEGAPFASALAAQSLLPLAVTGGFLDWWKRRGSALAPPGPHASYADADERSEFAGFSL